ncbi:uncharacterized protein DSM5745_07587 [Aspergillus mulundensis]|uniref:Uncharacterized protein n=1 Tax=Aspergillus mulundensis TaxID=1810919 RepID=A0A3D8RED3_9EURO|nr:hypothetical protein DSM5745_07587 [Aspergillus mulundensis]RDW72415.1 hypothetical protein DSM5745_07587 [Aspergillus mulundensis]
MSLTWLSSPQGPTKEDILISQILSFNESTFDLRDLATVGDYAGCLWKCILTFMQTHRDFKDSDRDVDLFWNKLSAERGNAKLPRHQRKVESMLQECLEELQKKGGPDMSFGTAVLVVAIYSLRNRTFHRDYASESISEDQITKADIARLNESRFKSDTHREALQGMMNLYSHGLRRLSKDSPLKGRNENRQRRQKEHADEMDQLRSSWAEFEQLWPELGSNILFIAFRSAHDNIENELFLQRILFRRLRFTSSPSDPCTPATYRSFFKSPNSDSSDGEESKPTPPPSSYDANSSPIACHNGSSYAYNDILLQFERNLEIDDLALQLAERENNQAKKHNGTDGTYLYLKRAGRELAEAVGEDRACMLTSREAKALFEARKATLVRTRHFTISTPVLAKVGDYAGSLWNLLLPLMQDEGSTITKVCAFWFYLKVDLRSENDSDGNCDDENDDDGTDDNRMDDNRMNDDENNDTPNISTAATDRPLKHYLAEALEKAKAEGLTGLKFNTAVLAIELYALRNKNFHRDRSKGSLDGDRNMVIKNLHCKKDVLDMILEMMKLSAPLM